MARCDRRNFTIRRRALVLRAAAALALCAGLRAHAQVATTTTLTASNATPTYTTPLAASEPINPTTVLLKATVVETVSSNPVGGGTVMFYDNFGLPGVVGPHVIGKASIQYATLGNAATWHTGVSAPVPGTATLPFSFGPGKHGITAVYSGTTGAPMLGGNPATPKWLPSSTAITASVTPTGLAYFTGVFSMYSPGKELFDDDVYGDLDFFDTPAQNPTSTIYNGYGFGMEVPQGTPTTTDQNTMAAYTPGAQTGVVTPFQPQQTVSSGRTGDYVYGLPYNSITSFFLADIFNGGLPAVVLLSSSQNQAMVYSLNDPNDPGTSVYMQQVTVAASPVQGVAADINGDGSVDVVIAHNDTTGVGIGVGVLINTYVPVGGTANPSGVQPWTLPETTYSIGHPASNVAVGDLNGDGKPDIIAVTADNTNLITMLLNDGTGNFTQGATVQAGMGASQVALGDFNQDGILDIAVLNTSDATIGIFQGNGDGTFQTMVPYSVGINPTAFTAADLNRDGYLDLAITNADNATQAEVSFLYGQSGGGFNYVSTQGASTNPNAFAMQASGYTQASPAPTAIQAIDLNGDGYLDLFIGTNVNQANWAIYNATTQTYTYNQVFSQDQPYADNFRTTSAAVADLNGDGLMDWLLMTPVNGNLSQPNNNNLMVRFTGALINQWTIPDAVNAPAGNHAFLSNYLPAANSIYGTVAIGPVTLSIVPTPLPDLKPSDYIYPDTVVGSSNTQVFVLNNAGSGPLTISSIGTQLTSGASNPFSITSGALDCPISPATLAANGHCDIVVAFTPGAPGSYAGTLVVNDNGGSNQQTSTLEGNGTGTASNVLNITETIMTSDALPVLAPATVLPVTEIITTSDAPPSLLLPTLLPITEIITTSDAPPALVLPTLLPITETITTSDAPVETPKLTATAVGLRGITPIALGSTEPITLSVSPQAATGTVNLYSDNTLLGTATLANGIANYNAAGLTAGKHNLYAVYAGNTTYATSTSNTLQVDVETFATATIVTSSQNPSVFEQSVTFTASVTAASGPASGSVVFSEGNTTLATVSLDNSGLAVYTAPSLSSGTHTITAAFQGNSGFLASNGLVTQVVAAPPLTITSVGGAPLSITVNAGSAASLNFNVTPNGSVSGTVAFSCTGLPTDTSCAFTPPSVAIASGSTAAIGVTLNLATKAQIARKVQRRGTSSLAMTFGLTGILLAGFGMRRKRLLLSAIACLAIGSATGCGSTSPTATPGTSTFQIVATSGITTTSASVSLTIR